MKETKMNLNNLQTLVEFNSISEFINYITTTPTNEAFQMKDKNNDLNSKKTGFERIRFTGTKSFTEAIDLCTKGQPELLEKIKQDLKNLSLNSDEKTTYKNCLNVCGYQAVVPLYLNGIPNNMVNKRITPIKNKILTISYAMSVNCGVTKEQMITEAVKNFKIINKLEADGYKVNLNLIMGCGLVVMKIKLKSANERLNISKLAFPLINPSMLRRLFFRFIETYPEYTSNFVYGYGKAQSRNYFLQICGKNEILLETSMKSWNDKTESIDEIVEKIKSKNN
jgi:hypothetical protein